MRIDIRILIASLAIHALVYLLLDFTSQPSRPQQETVELEIRNDETPRKQFNTVQTPDTKTNEDNTPANFLSDKQVRFKKQTISKNMGVPENHQPKQATQKEVQKETTKSLDGILKLPTAVQAQQDPRRSSVPFEVPHLAQGDFTFLNSDFSSYATFYSRITPQIVYRWGNNVQEISMFPHMIEQLGKKSKWTTRIELVLNRQGHLEDVITMNSSGSEELDAAVTRALKEATPFLNPPSGMIDESGRVHIYGEFTVYTQRPRLAK